jgi:predicted ATP-dependent serine protease
VCRTAPQKTTGKCQHTGKVNTIDNQLVTLKNTKITGKKPAKLEMNNKYNMTTAHKHINPLHVNQKNQINQWFRQIPPNRKMHTHRKSE